MLIRVWWYMGIITQKADFIQYELSGVKLGNINRGWDNFGNKNKFEGVSVYTTNYNKKMEIPNDGNDCRWKIIR